MGQRISPLSWKTTVSAIKWKDPIFSDTRYQAPWIFLAPSLTLGDRISQTRELVCVSLFPNRNTNLIIISLLFFHRERISIRTSHPPVSNLPDEDVDFFFFFTNSRVIFAQIKQSLTRYSISVSLMIFNDFFWRSFTRNSSLEILLSTVVNSCILGVIFFRVSPAFSVSGRLFPRRPKLPRNSSLLPSLSSKPVNRS